MILMTCLVICGASISELASTASPIVNQVQAKKTTGTPAHRRRQISGKNVPTNQVHMKDTDFAQHTVTIKKGESLILINDSFALHVIANGSWDATGNIISNAEVGAPNMNVEVTGESRQSIGPFTTAGTFHLYCTIHPQMNLTVIVR
jgi:plastocyanin